jgi:hypothetical protein
MGIKTCEHCTFWDGKDTAYLGLCTNPDATGGRVPFDHTCVLHNPRIEPVAAPSRVQCPKCGGIDLHHQSMGYMFYVLRCKTCQHTWP